MKKTNVIQINRAKKDNLHDALLELGFELFEGANVYVFDYVDYEGHSMSIMLEPEQTKSFQTAISALGGNFFNRVMPEDMRKHSYKLSQALMSKCQEIEEQKNEKMASNQ